MMAFHVLQLRNSLRFLLGNLHGFNPQVQAVAPVDMHYIDQYMLHLLHKYSIKVSNCSPSPSSPALSLGERSNNFSYSEY